MTCNEFRESATGDGSLSQDALSHSEDCSACAEWTTRYGRLTFGLRALSQETREDGAPARIEHRLLAAYRRHHGLPARGISPSWPAMIPLGAAAAIVAAFATLLVNERPRNPAPPRGSDMAVTDSIDLDAGAVGTEFVALPNTGGIGSGEQADVVRVELPRSAMLALGYPVSPERSDERVEADVILGPDGSARAVRFLE